MNFVQALRCSDTTIGSELRNHHKAFLVLMIAGTLALAADLAIVTSTRLGYLEGYFQPYLRTAVCGIWMLLAVSTVATAEISPKTLGFSFRVSPSIGFWIKATLVILGIISLIALGCAGCYRWYYGNWPDLPRDSTYFWSESLFWTCLFYPLWEEILYRQAMCVWLVPLVGVKTCILVNGLLFAALHFLYGNPSPDNFVAGYFLAWAYLKSGTLWVPIALHAVGNLSAYLFQFNFGQ